MQAVICKVERCPSHGPVILHVHAGTGIKVIATTALVHRSENRIIIRQHRPILAYERPVTGIHIHAEAFSFRKHRRPDKIKFRMELISGTRPQIELSGGLCRSRRLHRKQIWIELI